MTVDEALKMCLRALSTVLEKNFGIERIDAAVVSAESKMYEKIDKAQIERAYKDIKKK